MNPSVRVARNHSPRRRIILRPVCCLYWTDGRWEFTSLLRFCNLDSRYVGHEQTLLRSGESPERWYRRVRHYRCTCVTVREHLFVGVGTTFYSETGGINSTPEGARQPVGSTMPRLEDLSFVHMCLCGFFLNKNVRHALSPALPPVGQAHLQVPF